VGTLHWGLSGTAHSQLPYLFNKQGTVNLDIFLFSFDTSENPTTAPQPAWEGSSHFASVTHKVAEFCMGETTSAEMSIMSLTSLSDVL